MARINLNNTRLGIALMLCPHFEIASQTQATGRFFDKRKRRWKGQVMRWDISAASRITGSKFDTEARASLWHFMTG